MKRFFFYFVFYLSLISCSRDSTSPNNRDTSLLVYFERNDQIWAYNYNDKEENLLYESMDKKIISFDYLEKLNSTYFIFFEDLDTNSTHRTTIAKLNAKGEMIEIYKNETLGGEGFNTFLDVYVSDDEKYMALTGTYYEGGFFRVYDIVNEEFVQFDGSQYTEYVSFLTWGPDNRTIYVKSHEYLLLYDFEDKTITMLESPNIRDYLSEDYLLSVGYVGKRFDYDLYINTDSPQYINWEEAGNKFVYINNDSMYLFDIENGNSEYLFHIDDYRSNRKTIDVLWNNISDENNSRPYFNDNDIIVSFDSTSLKPIPSLNDSLYRYVGKSYSISYIRPNWNNISNSWDKYYFRNEITPEKIHVAEFDFHMWYYALFYVPEYWSLVVTLDHENFISDDFINKFSEYNEQYQDDYQYFININYPQSLIHKQVEYENRQYIDLQFQYLFLEFYINQDTLTFKNDVYNLLSEFDTLQMDELFYTLEDPEIIGNERLIIFYMLIHNSFLNFYGQLINRDIELIKEELLIDELPDDWLYKAGGLYTIDYLRYKKYEYK